jgi:hypothetical protein
LVTYEGRLVGRDQGDEIKEILHKYRDAILSLIERVNQFLKLINL